MGVLVVFAKLALAAAFAVAGVAKIPDRDGFRATVVEFGVPPSLIAPTATLVPALEIAIAGLLLSSRLSRIGAGAALLLLATFTLAIAVNLLRGRRPDCRCFGQFHASPIDWTTVARNVTLTACAAIVLWLPEQPLGGLTLSMFANGLQLVLLFELLRQHGRLRLRLDRLAAGPAMPVGSLAPALDELRRDASLPSAAVPSLLLFTEADCPPCRALWPEVAKWERVMAGALTIVVVASGARHVNAALARDHGIRHVLVQQDREIAEQYHVSATPSAVLVGADGRIASHVAIGRTEIEALLRL